MEKKRSRCKKGSRWNKTMGVCKEYVIKSSRGSTRKTPVMPNRNDGRLDLIVEKLDQLPTKEEVESYLGTLNASAHARHAELLNFIESNHVSPEVQFVAPTPKMNDIENPMRVKQKKASVKKFGPKELAKFKFYSRVNKHALLGKKPKSHVVSPLHITKSSRQGAEAQDVLKYIEAIESKNGKKYSPLTKPLRSGAEAKDLLEYLANIESTKKTRKSPSKR